MEVLGSSLGEIFLFLGCETLDLDEVYYDRTFDNDVMKAMNKNE